MPAPSARVSAARRVARKPCQESSRRFATRIHRVCSQEPTRYGVSSGPSGVSVLHILRPELRLQGVLLRPSGVKVNAFEENGMEVGGRRGQTTGVKVAERWRMRTRPAARDSAAADVRERLRAIGEGASLRELDGLVRGHLVLQSHSACTHRAIIVFLRRLT